MESAHRSLSKPDCNNTADVPSLALRTALSALPFDSDLCGVGLFCKRLAKFQGIVSDNDFRFPRWLQEPL